MTSASDRAVLEIMFNPLLPTGGADIGAESDVNFEEGGAEEAIDTSAMNPADLEKVKSLEKEGVLLAESQNYDGALAKFTQAVTLVPAWPSAYNNRAQVYRLKGDVNDALSDLEKALELSGGKGRTAKQAYAQRALIHRLNGHDDLAKSDLEASARLGSQFAKHQLVQLNPYAAMCNKMLADVVGRLQRGEPEDQCEDSEPPA